MCPTLLDPKYPLAMQIAIVVGFLGALVAWGWWAERLHERDVRRVLGPPSAVIDLGARRRSEPPR